MHERILLVEDEPALVMTLTDRLAGDGYVVESTGDGRSALAMAAGFDLILLDVGLPGKSGFDVCRELRQGGFERPILMLTARDAVVDKVVGLKLGADDYLTKPFDPAELLARIEALLRRSARPASTTVAGDVFRFGDVVIDGRSGEVTRGGTVVELTAMEFRLLKYLVQHPRELLSRQALLDEVWGYDATPTTRTVDVHIAWLRQKIEPNPRNPRHLVTAYGLGYRFDP